MKFALIVRTAFVVFFLASAGALKAQETFHLSAPGLTNPSEVTIDAHELVIADTEGQITRYQRLPRYDTADQQYISYSSKTAQQVILWPVSNSGRMQIGTLQNGRVQFAMSKMSIASPANGARNPGGLPSNDAFGPGPGLGRGEAVNNAADFARMRDAARVNGGNVGRTVESLPMTAIQLAAGENNDRHFLSSSSAGRILSSRQSNDISSAWYVVPVGNDMVRLQQMQNNQWSALGMDDAVLAQVNDGRFGNNIGLNQQGAFGAGGIPRGGSFGGNGFGNRIGNGRVGANAFPPIGLLPIQNNANQLWQLTSGIGGGYYFESVLFPGYGLTFMPNNGLALQPMAYNPWQTWWPQQPSFTLPPPQFRTVDHRVVPNAPLPAATVRFANSHSETLFVMVTDRRNVRQPMKLRIPSGQVEQLQLDRDSGSMIVETVEIMDRFGNWNRDQYQTPIPPKVIYDVSVYEEFIQSIAIDRTGASPSAIEDINVQPRSIGFFLIPPGDAVQNFAEVDTYNAAMEAQNPGAARKISPRDLQNSPSQSAPADPLRDLLNQFQKKRAAF